MDTLKLKFVFNRKKIANNTNKLGSLEIYVYDSVTQKKVYISTGIELLLNQFVRPKGEKGKIVKHANAINLNGKADRMYRQIEAFTLSDKCNRIEDVKNWNNENYSSLSIISFMESELIVRGKSLSIGTYKHHRTIINKILSFGKINSFRDLTYSNISDFDHFMRKEGLSDISLYKNHSILRSYIKEAVKRDLINKSPYDKFEPKKGRSSDPVYLTNEEVQKIKDEDLSGIDEKIVKTRDLFLIQCRTGLSYIDMKNFTRGDISIIDGHEIISNKRIKTEERYTIVLLPETKIILEKYNYKLAVISNQKYNDYLKLLAGYCGINKRITTHVGRHTYATYLLNEGVSIEAVAASLGHSDLRMTQHYAKMLNITSIRNVVNNVLKKEK